MHRTPAFCHNQLRRLVLGVASLLFTVVGRPEGTALLVPAYFSPSSGRWERVADAAARVPLVAIANIFNGPGTDLRPAYGDAMARVRAAGGQVIGYVYTQYGNRPLETVKQDMRLWHERYRIDGFFVDEMTNDSGAAHLAYYADLRDYARQLRASYRLIGNPGTNTDEAYLKYPVADVVVIFENRTGYPAFVPSAWTRRYSETRLGHLTYAVPTPEQMTNFVQLAITKRAGLIYVTDDSGNNPWDTLPTYWEAEVSLLESLNRAAAIRVGNQLQLDGKATPLFTLQSQGAVGRYVLESASPLGEWRPLATNLTNTGTSVWQLLNVAPNRFFRLRQD